MNVGELIESLEDDIAKLKDEVVRLKAKTLDDSDYEPKGLRLVEESDYCRIFEYVPCEAAEVKETAFSRWLEKQAEKKTPTYVWIYRDKEEK